jgi:hypothetical protein
MTTTSFRASTGCSQRRSHDAASSAIAVRRLPAGRRRGLDRADQLSKRVTELEASLRTAISLIEDDRGHTGAAGDWMAMARRLLGEGTSLGVLPTT